MPVFQGIYFPLSKYRQNVLLIFVCRFVENVQTILKETNDKEDFCIFTEIAIVLFMISSAILSLNMKQMKSIFLFRLRFRFAEGFQTCASK